jgi:hypothetical protein
MKLFIWRSSAPNVRIPILEWATEESTKPQEIPRNAYVHTMNEGELHEWRGGDSVSRMHFVEEIYWEPN